MREQSKAAKSREEGWTCHRTDPKARNSTHGIQTMEGNVEETAVGSCCPFPSTSQDRSGYCLALIDDLCPWWTAREDNGPFFFSFFCFLSWAGCVCK